MDWLRVVSVSALDGTLSVQFEVSAGLSRYFSSSRVFEVAYSEEVSSVPLSVLVIPFVCNVLPIIWLTDAVLEVPQLDKEFYECIPEIKQGYMDMSPMLTFKGAVRVGEVVDNHYVPTEKTAAFFSGGVDAFATLVAHANERPQLITLWGADVKLTDVEGWERVKAHVVKTSGEFDLPAPLFVRSNLRDMLDEKALSEVVRLSGDGWWHGFQHGIAISGHAAPFAYLKRWQQVYIASSNTIKDKVICASDPTIDNKVRLVSGSVWHDQYEWNRQQKVQHIVEFCRETGKRVWLRVCWQSRGGSNCCHCEKCTRTIYNLLAEGAQPADYGLGAWEKFVREGVKTVRLAIYKMALLRLSWRDIQNRFKETQAYRTDARIQWIYALDVEHALTGILRVKVFFKSISKTLRGWIKRKR